LGDATLPQVWPAAGGLKADVSAGICLKRLRVFFAKFAQIARSKLTGSLQMNSDFSRSTEQGVPCSKRLHLKVIPLCCLIEFCQKSPAANQQMLVGSRLALLFFVVPQVAVYCGSTPEIAL